MGNFMKSIRVAPKSRKWVFYLGPPTCLFDRVLFVLFFPQGLVQSRSAPMVSTDLRYLVKILKFGRGKKMNHL